MPNSPILVTLMLEALRSYETSVLTRTTNIPEEAIHHSYCRENLILHNFTNYNISFFEA
jgi:hypothetical protein